MPGPLRLALTATAVALAVPAVAPAAPPRNDNYLGSASIVNAGGRLPSHFSEKVDTSEATTQPDMFDPDNDGLPLGGGDPEPTTCGGTSFGRTAWWDFRPPRPGAVQIKAAGGFDVVVAVYEWSRRTSRITRLVKCQNADPDGETVDVSKVRKDHDYTVQVGGAGNTGGPLGFTLDFGDRDRDGVFDRYDRCPSLAGAKRGCPPALRSAPRIRYDEPGAGVRLRSLTIAAVPKGARAEVRCTRCAGAKVVKKARRSGSLSIGGMRGRRIGAGGALEIRVTMARQKKGRFRYGAIGRYFRYPVTNAGLGKRKLRCLDPGSRKPVKCR